MATEVLHTAVSKGGPAGGKRKKSGRSSSITSNDEEITSATVVKRAKEKEGDTLKKTLKRQLDAEDRRNCRQRRVQAGLPDISLIHDRRPITTDTLEEEGIEFAQLTRPSYLQWYELLLPHLRGPVDRGELILFHVRPIKQSKIVGCSPDTLTTEQVIWAFGTVGVHTGWLGRFPSYVMEYAVLIHLSDARNVPRKDDPLLRTDPSQARANTGGPICPLLIERIDGETLTPSRLLWYDRPSVERKERRKLPHHSLHRNSIHPDESKRVIIKVLDNQFNVIPFEHGSEHPVDRKSNKEHHPLNFEKSTHQSSRDRLSKKKEKGDSSGVGGEQKLAAQVFGLSWCWANALVDWIKVRTTQSETVWEKIPWSTLTVVDGPDRAQDDPEVRTFVQYTCAEACFAESTICHDKTGHCRFLQWDNPYAEWDVIDANKYNPRPASK